MFFRTEAKSDMVETFRQKEEGYKNIIATLREELISQKRMYEEQLHAEVEIRQ